MTNFKDLKNYKKIAIIGRPRVGKTTLAKQLGDALGYDVVSTDDFIGKHSFEDAPEKIIEQLLKKDRPYIIEGVQTARMIRKGYRLKTWEPDVVIEVDADIELEPGHKGLASLQQKAIFDWIKESGGKIKIIKHKRAT